MTFPWLGRSASGVSDYTALRSRGDVEAGCHRGGVRDAGWQASVIFASMYTPNDQRDTLVCWGADLLVEADEEDIDAVEAHLMKWFEVKVLARIGGKSSGEVEFLKRVLWYDAVTESFLWCSGQCHVQDTTATLQLTGRSHFARRHTPLARRALVRHCQTETRSSARTRQPSSGAPCDQ